jgi:hypothetical protein
MNGQVSASSLARIDGVCEQREPLVTVTAAFARAESDCHQARRDACRLPSLRGRPLPELRAGPAARALLALPKETGSGARAATGAGFLWEGPRRIGAHHLAAVALCVGAWQLIHHPMVS